MMKTAALSALMILTPLAAHAACADALKVENAYVRPTMAGKDVTAAFFDVTNTGEETLRITGVAAEGAMAELHTTLEENGVFKMRHLDEVEIPSGMTVQFKPHSLHVMLMKQQNPVVEGDEATLTLQCEDGTQVPVKAAVTAKR